MSLPLVQLEMVGTRLVSIKLTFSDNSLVDIQLVTSPLLSGVSELNIAVVFFFFLINHLCL